MRAIHELKTWPQPYTEVLAGRKTYEVRRFDRPFKVDDVLKLREYRPQWIGTLAPGYTGRVLFAEVTYITFPGQWGMPGPHWVKGELDPGLGVMAIRLIPEDERMSLGLFP